MTENWKRKDFYIMAINSKPKEKRKPLWVLPAVIMGGFVAFGGMFLGINRLATETQKDKIPKDHVSLATVKKWVAEQGFPLCYMARRIPESPVRRAVMIDSPPLNEGMTPSPGVSYCTAWNTAITGGQKAGAEQHYVVTPNSAKGFDIKLDPRFHKSAKPNDPTQKNYISPEDLRKWVEATTRAACTMATQIPGSPVKGLTDVQPKVFSDNLLSKRFGCHAEGKNFTVSGNPGDGYIITLYEDARFIYPKTKPGIFSP